MSADLAWIVVNTAQHALGGVEQYEYVWEGAGDRALVSRRYIPFSAGHPRPVGTVVTLGGLRVRVVAPYDWNYDAYFVMRDGRRARLAAIIGRVNRPLERIYHRLILTAAVWGCAKYDPALIPTWRDLRWPGWRRREKKETT